MPPRVEVTIASRANLIPPASRLAEWACAALPARSRAELGIRVVTQPEMQMLNKQYRGKDKTTNVLSFAADLPDGIELPLIGDIAVCAAVVSREARQQGKRPEAHWAHMIIHGTLHLQGFDHENERDARKMENRERRILAELGFDDPY